MEMADSTHIMRACEEPGPWGGGLWLDVVAGDVRPVTVDN